jgi:hypothetical protein
LGKNGAREYGVKHGFSGIDITNDLRLWSLQKTYILGERWNGAGLW